MHGSEACRESFYQAVIIVQLCILLSGFASQEIIWLFDPCRVSLELLSSVLGGFTNELSLWKTKRPH